MFRFFISLVSEFFLTVSKEDKEEEKRETITET